MKREEGALGPQLVPNADSAPVRKGMVLDAGDGERNSMFKRMTFWIVVAAVVVVLGIAGWLRVRQARAANVPRFETAKLERGRVVAKVTASVRWRRGTNSATTAVAFGIAPPRPIPARKRSPPKDINPWAATIPEVATANVSTLKSSATLRPNRSPATPASGSCA